MAEIITDKQPKDKIYYPHCYVEIQAVFDGVSSAQTGSPSAVPLQVTAIRCEPKECRVYLNSLKEADTFDFTIDEKEAPYPLEAMRTGGVRIFLFQTNELVANPSDLVSVLTATENASNKACVLVGIIDEVERELDAMSGGYMYHVSGRDLTGLMLNRQWPTQHKVALGDDFVTCIQNVVDLATGWSQYDSTGSRLIRGPAQTNGTADTTVGTRLNVVWLDGTGDWVTLDQLGNYHLSTKDKKLLTGAAPSLPTQAKAQGKKEPKATSKTPVASRVGRQTLNKKGIPVKKKNSYWDVITSLCAQKGYDVFVRGYNVVIADPETIIRTNAQTDEYFMVFGANIKKYQVKRKLNKESVPQIKVYWYDNHAKQVYSEVYPSDSTFKINGITVDQTKQIEVPAPWCNDAGVAKTIAKQYYNDLSRNQGNITIETKDLLDLSDTQKDLLQIRVGYPLTVTFADAWHEVLNDKTAGELYKIFKSKGYTEQTANTLASYWQVINTWHDSPYYVKEVKYDWSLTEGIGIEVTLFNFINPTDDQLFVEEFGNEQPTTGIASKESAR